jgi:hypothetical protein
MMLLTGILALVAMGQPLEAYPEFAAHHRCVRRAAAMAARSDETIEEASRLAVNLCAPFLDEYEAALYAATNDENAAARRAAAVSRVSISSAERIVTRLRICGDTDACEDLFSPTIP